MQKFQLDVFLKIMGIGSASGLVFHQNSLFVISDNSSFLYEYHLDTNKLVPIPLLDNAQNNILKSEKPDFEAIALHDTNLYVFGSGSTTKRNQMIQYNTVTQEIQPINQDQNYRSLETLFDLQPHQLNIEGVIFDQEFVYLFQRGNGVNNQNGIFKIHNFGKQKPEFHLITLPKIKGVEASFTDAVLVVGTIYFLASAEDTISTYDDGEILGTFLGTISLKDFSLENTVLITEKHKFEGITLYQKTESEIEFLLCEDNDTELLESTIYKIKIAL